MRGQTGKKYKVQSPALNHAIETLMDTYGHICLTMNWNKYEFHRMTPDFVTTNAELLKTIMKTLESKYTDELIVEIKRLPVGTETIFRKAYDGYIHILKPKTEKQGFLGWLRPQCFSPSHVYHQYTSILMKYRETKRFVRAFKTILPQSNGKPPLMCYLNIDQLPIVPVIPNVHRPIVGSTKNKDGYQHL